MSFIMVDVEADGPCPGMYSMVSFGAVVVRPGLKDTFYACTQPLEDASWDANALAVSGVSRGDHLAYPHPAIAMEDFRSWLFRVSQRQHMFVSDNNGFDWQWINWYFWKFCNSNPFGHSSTNLGSLYKGIVRDTFKNFKHLRKTKHSHHPVDDAKGNAEALLYLRDEMRLKVNLV